MYFFLSVQCAFLCVSETTTNIEKIPRKRRQNLTKRLSRYIDEKEYKILMMVNGDHNVN